MEAMIMRMTHLMGAECCPTAIDSEGMDEDLSGTRSARLLLQECQQVRSCRALIRNVRVVGLEFVRTALRAP